MAITHANSTFLTVCQDEGAISQAWLKQAMAHKATLAQSVLKLTVIQVPRDTLHHRSPSRRSHVSNKGASHTTPAKPDHD